MLLYFNIHLVCVLYLKSNNHILCNFEAVTCTGRWSSSDHIAKLSYSVHEWMLLGYTIMKINLKLISMNIIIISPVK